MSLTPDDARRQLSLLTAALEELPLFAGPRALLEGLPALFARQGEGHVSVWVPEDSRLRVLAAWGFDPQALPYLAEEGVVGRAYRQGEPVYVADVAQDPGYIALEGHAVTSELALPLRVSGEVVAVLNLERPCPFAEAELEGYVRFARAASHQLTRLYERLQFELTSRLGEEVGQAEDFQDAARRALDHLLPALGGTTGAILVQQGGLLRAVALAGEGLRQGEGSLEEGIPYGRWLSWQVLSSGRPFFASAYDRSACRLEAFKAAGTRAMALYPIPLGPHARTRALLALGDSRPRRWLRVEREVLAAASRTLGLSFATFQTQERLATLLALAREAVEAPPEAVYQRLVEAAVRLVPGAQTGSLLVREDGGFRYRAVVGFDLTAFAPVTLTEGQQRAWYGPDLEAWRRGEPRILALGADSLAAWSRGSGMPPGFDEFTRVREIASTLALPVPYQGEVLAVLNLDNFHDPAAFDEDSLEAARLFVPPVAALLHELDSRRRLEMAALTDALTGLPNRRAFDRFFPEELARARRYGYPLALLVMDLRGFKRINDELGHATGDQALRRVAQVLSAQRRGGDRYFRWGGDEFAAILPHTPRGGAAGAAERLAGHVEAIVLEGRPLGVNVGVAAFPEDGTDEDTLLSTADHRMYRAKTHGVAVWAQ
ncbi:Diguanylate cyclase DosC [Calidithermus terrae]|uniref:Diguanylate cyclase DosC n=1 Tax=Calidithermus terrae TaxID=1408545 RepID=A0A399DX37_9DEIN|nr:diguanylate cyclase [Calidithermus terrae]RIH76794.1 Diguanylate cyclase DosC [Calidithermus terrae]